MEYCNETMVELKTSEIESIWIDPQRIVLISHSPVGVEVALDIGGPIPYRISIIQSLSELLDTFMELNHGRRIRS